MGYMYYLSSDEMSSKSCSCTSPTSYDSEASNHGEDDDTSQAVGYEESEELHLISLHNWVNYEDLKKWCRLLVTTQFFEDFSRHEARNAFVRISVWTNIVNEVKRFPTNFYVCLGNKAILGIILNIMMSLDIPASPETIIDEFIQARKLAFDSAVKDLNMALCSTNYKTMAAYGIYTRKNFENSYSLVWNDA